MAKTVADINGDECFKISVDYVIELFALESGNPRPDEELTHPSEKPLALENRNLRVIEEQTQPIDNEEPTRGRSSNNRSRRFIFNTC